MEAQLFDPDGRPVFDEPLSGDGDWPFEWGKMMTPRGEVRLSAPVDSPRLWSAETPDLYTLVVTLHHAGGPGKHGLHASVSARSRCAIASC